MVIVRHRYRHRWPLTSCFPVSKKRPGPPASFIHQAFKSRWTWVRGQVCCQYHLFYSKRLAHSLGKSYSYLTVAWCVRLWNAQTSYWQFERQRFAISTTTLIPLHLQSVDGKTLLALHIEEWQVSHLRGIGDWKLWSWLGLKICSALVSFGKQSMLQHFLDSIHTALLRFGVLSTWMAKRRQYHLMARRWSDALKPFKSFSRDLYRLLDTVYLQLTSHEDEYAVKEIVCKTQVCAVELCAIYRFVVLYCSLGSPWCPVCVPGGTAKRAFRRLFTEEVSCTLQTTDLENDQTFPGIVCREISSLAVICCPLCHQPPGLAKLEEKAHLAGLRASDWTRSNGALRLFEGWQWWHMAQAKEALQYTLPCTILYCVRFFVEAGRPECSISLIYYGI